MVLLEALLEVLGELLGVAVIIFLGGFAVWSLAKLCGIELIDNEEID
jgi:hypothetical protein